MKYHSLFINFEKTTKFEISMLQIIGGALRVKATYNRWSIVYIEGSEIIIFKRNIVFLSLKINFV